MVAWLQETGEIYQGQFGQFTVTAKDRLSVVLYRTALTTAAAAWALGTVLVLEGSRQPSFVTVLSILFALFCSALGVCLWTIHIYLKPLHIALQLCWGVGCATALIVAATHPGSLWTALYSPFSLELVGIGLVFVALTGLFVKEAFCFNRWQAKLLILVVPVLLMGHWLGLLAVPVEKLLLGTWATVFLWFSLDKDTQSIPPDVGDKTVFDYLHQMRQSEVN